MLRVHRLADRLLPLRLGLVCTVYTSKDSVFVHKWRCTKMDTTSHGCKTCAYCNTALNSHVRAIRQYTRTGNFCSTCHSCSSARHTLTKDNLLHELNTYYHTVCSYTIPTVGALGTRRALDERICSDPVPRRSIVTDEIHAIACPIT